MLIENVSDTARWVAVYRAMETERPDAIFRDPFARRLAGERGQAIADKIGKKNTRAWAMIVRTKSFDEMILQAIAQGPVDLVVNLAAGLDARPWRLAELPATLRWVDVDLPGILAHKAGVIGDTRPVCRYESIAADLADPAVRAATLARVCAGSQMALVISEGLLIYLTAEQVGDLARDVAAQAPVQAWLFDLANPALLAMMQRDWGSEVEKGRAPFQFAPAEGPEFFRPFGWQVAERRSTVEEARRLRRQHPMAWLWQLLWPITPAPRREEIRWLASYVRLEKL